MLTSRDDNRLRSVKRSVERGEIHLLHWREVSRKLGASWKAKTVAKGTVVGPLLRLICQFGCLTKPAECELGEDKGLGHMFGISQQPNCDEAVVV